MDCSWLIGAIIVIIGLQSFSIAASNIPATAPSTVLTETPQLRVEAFSVKYAKEHAGLPPVQNILQCPIELKKVPGGYVSRQGSGEMTRLSLAGLSQDAPLVSANGVRDLEKQIQEFINSAGIVGVLVYPKDLDLDHLPADAAAMPRTIEFVVVVGVVKDVRSIVSGDGAEKDPDGGINRMSEERIRRNSPVQPTTRRDLLNKDELEDYLALLNRQPGRHVEMALSSDGNEDEVTVDYLVRQTKPWFVYAELSNTGTRDTSEWREKFGFVDNQLTHHDDILSLNYSTASFGPTQEFDGSYDLPMTSDDRLRFKIYGTWNQFTASDVGLTQINLDGSGWTAGGELSWNFFQHRQWFADAIVGGREDEFRVNDNTLDEQGKAEFFVPYLGVRVERNTETDSTRIQVTGETNATRISSAVDRDALGRLNTDGNYVLLRGNIGESFYLEPLLFSGDFDDPQSPHAKLANEIVGTLRGQYAFDHRLIPEYQQAAGGLYSVRGYPESVIAGDSAGIASLEYRFHLPRALGIGTPGTFLGHRPGVLGDDFRYQPPAAYAQPDWDLVPTAFIDAAIVGNSHGAANNEPNSACLAGAGVGITFRLKDNLTVTTDYAWALNSLNVPGVSWRGRRKIQSGCHASLLAEGCAMNRSKRIRPLISKLVLPVAAACQALFLPLLMEAAQASPRGAQVVSGQASFSQAGPRLTITAGNNAIINYQSFNIARGETVTFVQPFASARVLNRVLGLEPTEIDGVLRGNGQVYILNQQGVYFGSTAMVDVGQLVAAGGHLSNADFLGGVDHFTGVTGIVSNSGGIYANGVSLIGGQVVNTGTINADRGAVVMAAGNDVYIGHANDDVLVKVAPGATINHNSSAVGDIYSLAINHTGSTTAGQIILNGGSGNVEVSGRLEASSHGARQTGGRVVVTGGDVTLNSASVDASGSAGGGTIYIGGESHGEGTIPAANDTTLSADSTLKADALADGNGGAIVVWSNQSTDFAGQISARGSGGGAGGSAEVSSGGKLLFDGSADLTGPAGTGTLLMDPLTWTIASSGGDQTPASLVSALNLANVSILATVSISVNNAVNASGNTNSHNLTLDAPTVNLSAPITLNGQLVPGLTNLTVNVHSGGSINNGTALSRTFCRH